MNGDGCACPSASGDANATGEAVVSLPSKVAGDNGGFMRRFTDFSMLSSRLDTELAPPPCASMCCCCLPKKCLDSRFCCFRMKADSVDKDLEEAKRRLDNGKEEEEMEVKMKAKPQSNKMCGINCQVRAAHNIMKFNDEWSDYMSRPASIINVLTNALFIIY
jgi:hypothetical protein